MGTTVEKCAICGEPCDGRAGGTAEMYDAAMIGMYGEQAGEEGYAGIVHAECGRARGWEVA